jgi:DNA-binding phage protein
MAKSVPFESVLSSYLTDPVKAMSYLQSALEENDPDLFLVALRDVAEVQGVISSQASSPPKLVESLRRHGVSDDVITAVLSELNSRVDAA